MIKLDNFNKKTTQAGRRHGSVRFAFLALSYFQPIESKSLPHNHESLTGAPTHASIGTIYSGTQKLDVSMLDHPLSSIQNLKPGSWQSSQRFITKTYSLNLTK